MPPVSPPPHTPFSPLHGRVREQDALTELLARARSGGSGALVLQGEPGIGKTALLEFARASAEGCTVLHTRGVVSESGLAFAGLHRLLRPVMDQARTLPWQQRRALDGALELGSGAEQRDRFLLSVAVLSLLSEVARSGPVLVCADDVHWLDVPSLDALAFVARRLDTEGVAMLFAARQDCSGEPGGERMLEEVPALRLSRLEDEAIGGILAASFGEPLGEGVRGPLVRAAGGNPLAAVELAASLSARQLAGQEPLPEPLPSSRRLHHAYTERLDALPPGTRRLLLFLALDEELDDTALLLCAQRAGIDIAALQAAERTALLRRDEERFSFRHPLIRSAVYQSTGLAERHAAHRLLAGVCADRGHRRRRIWHQAATAVGPDAELAAELEEAAAQARSRSGYATSSGWFERAAELTPAGTGQTARLHEAARDAWLAGHAKRARTLADRVRRLPATDEVSGRTDLLLGDIELRDGLAIDAHVSLRAAAERLVNGHRLLALRTFLHAGEAGDLAGDHVRYLETADRVAALRRPEEPPESRIIFDYIAGKAANFRGDYSASLQPLRRVQADAVRMGDYDSLIWGMVASHLLGDELQAHKLAAEAVTVARRLGAVTVVPHALEFQSYTAFWTGRYPLAAANALEGLRLARETEQENSASHHQAALAMIAAIRGDEEECRRNAEAATAHAQTHDLGLPAALAAWARAFLDLTHGRYAECAARLRALARSAPGRGHLTIRGVSTPHFVEAAVRTGDEQNARKALDAYRSWAETTGSPSMRALVARCHALLSEGEEAQEYFAESLRLHQSCHRDFDRAHTQLLYGSLLRRNRMPTAAREHLHPALETFQRLNARTWYERATGELRAAGEVVRPREDAALERLSPQQLQIARFVAQGATNREVAAQLFLSPRTVDHHLRNVFAKLGLRSRVELVRLLG